MDQARRWICAKTRKPNQNPHALLARPMNPLEDSWEEQAFAEDAAGALGGCVWPPRSYSCSFCRREFRSAQALGGHMNVHRRDRARLKQADQARSAEVVPSVRASSACTSQIWTSSLYGNPNPELSGPRFRVNRVSSPPAGKSIGNEEKTNTTLGFLPPFVSQNDLVLPRRVSWSSFMAGKRNRESSGLEKNEKKFKNVILESRVENEDCVTEDLLVGFNLLVGRMRTSDEKNGSCKRRRVGEKPSSLVPPVGAADRCAARPEVLKSCPWPAEELDLELRLGSASKVK